MDDILNEYGPNGPEPQVPRITKNGPAECKPLRYSPPWGPKGLGHEGPGLGGDNCGNEGTQGKR